MLFRPNRSSLMAALFVCSALLPVQQASAHAHLIEQAPVENSTVPTPSQLQLTFSEGIEMNFSQIVLNDARGQIVPTSNPVVATQDKTHIVIPLTTTLSSGEYRVTWRVVSVDGHKTQGAYAFRVQ
ncbi:copper homeostasis periplasmic binding protein CopC [Enterobacillus tribolii]|uniref:Copper resistance protein C n=1 Tax=Enterobacillus tribolii TaxID=1487935 RepID=A0A370R3Q0_9GAMM|nr:copper homeostasis periplasmic binding protein CopC [Enterobacillus tribolii]MBW7984329.1 copper resistance protein CopC [Enterobacillus tribolii]RDK97066.1 hypothetical protein C8D90_101510 [Enterobacillus tribolii]